MTLEIQPETKVHTIWFVGWGKGDLLAYVFKQPGEPWKGEYRFRYHTAKKGGDPFQEDDEKRFYGFKAKHDNDPPDELVSMLEGVCQITQARYRADVFDRLVINGSGEDALREMEKQDWCFMKKVEEVDDTDGLPAN